MTVPRNTSLLEKWLEDMPNSNNSVNVKKERKDFRDIFASNSSASANHKNPNSMPTNATNSTSNVINNGSTRPTNSSAVGSSQSKVCFYLTLFLSFI